jgi:hypothetical protein
LTAAPLKSSPEPRSSNLLFETQRRSSLPGKSTHPFARNLNPRWVPVLHIGPRGFCTSFTSTTLGRLFSRISSPIIRHTKTVSTPRHGSNPTLRWQYHLTLVQQSKSANIPSTSASAATIAAPRTPARRTELSSAKLEAMSVEVCQNFNRINGCRWGSYHNGAKCPRRHDCTICLGSGHNALNCPRKKSASHT